MEKHLCACMYTLSLCWQVHRNAGDAFEGAVRNPGGILVSGSVHCMKAPPCAEDACLLFSAILKCLWRQKVVLA